MSFDNKDSRLDRRQMLKRLGASGAMVGVAGCSGGGGQETETTTGGGESTTEADETTTAEPSERSVGGTFVAAQTSEGRSLSPYNFGDEATGDRLDRLFDGGYSINEQLEAEPRWFKKWELSDSADVIEYELQDNLQYGNGYGQMTTEDWMYNLETVWSPSVENWTGFSYQTELQVAGEEVTVEKTGKLSMRMELPEPRANFIHDDPFGYFIPAPKGLLEKYAPDKNYEGFQQDEEVTKALYSGNLGPYKFNKWNRSSKLVLERNDEYYAREKLGGEFANAPYFDTLEFQVFSEQSTAMSALEAGDVHLAGPSERRAQKFENNDDTTVWTSRYGDGLFYLNINLRKNGWSELRKKGVRQALAHAVNKDTVIDQVLQGYGDPLDTFHPRWGPYYDDSAIKTFSNDMEEAKSKLESATSSDYSYDGDTFVGPDGEQLQLEMVIVSGSNSTKTTAQYIQSQLKKLGIKLNITSTEWSNLIGNYAQNSAEDPDWSISGYNGGPRDQATSKNDWDLMYGLGFSAGAYTPWNVVDTLFSEKGSFNMTGFVPEIDLKSKLNEAGSASSKEEAQEIMTEVFGYLSEEQPYVFMMSEHILEAYRSKVGGLEDPENFFTTNYPGNLDKDLYFTE